MVELVRSPEFFEFSFKHKLISSKIRAKSKKDKPFDRKKQVRSFLLKAGIKGEEKKQLIKSFNQSFQKSGNRPFNQIINPTLGSFRSKSTDRFSHKYRISKQSTRIPWDSEKSIGNFSELKKRTYQPSELSQNKFNITSKSKFYQKKTHPHGQAQLNQIQQKMAKTFFSTKNESKENTLSHEPTDRSPKPYFFDMFIHQNAILSDNNLQLMDRIMNDNLQTKQKTIKLNRLRGMHELCAIYNSCSKIKRKVQYKLNDPKTRDFLYFKKYQLSEKNQARLRTMEVFAFKTESKKDPQSKFCLDRMRGEKQPIGSCHVVDLWSVPDMNQMMNDTRYDKDKRKIKRYEYMTTFNKKLLRKKKRKAKEKKARRSSTASSKVLSKGTLNMGKAQKVRTKTSYNSKMESRVMYKNLEPEVYLQDQRQKKVLNMLDEQKRKITEIRILRKIESCYDNFELNREDIIKAEDKYFESVRRRKAIKNSQVQGIEDASFEESELNRRHTFHYLDRKFE